LRRRKNIMRRTFLTILSLTLLSSFCWAEEQVPIQEQKAKDSYSLGYDFGSNVKRQGVDVDLRILLSAVTEGLEGKKPAISPEEIRTTLIELRKKLMTQQERRSREFAAKNLEQGMALLEANKTKEGVMTLPSGLQYKVVKEGSGPSPKPTEAVRVHYRGTLVNGTEFDSSERRGEPAKLNLAGVIKGWREALQLMPVGSKWQIFVPPDLGYGNRQFGRIPPNSTLVFDLELLSIEKGLIPTGTELGAMGATQGEEWSAQEGCQPTADE
jgi:FKBP-type peptidyl-prolyl cis-trans isomerase FklB